ncbi:hypothetical protein PMIN06_012281 [Paraphaeosphaeria minitans]
MRHTVKFFYHPLGYFASYTNHTSYISPSGFASVLIRSPSLSSVSDSKPPPFCSTALLPHVPDAACPRAKCRTCVFADPGTRGNRRMFKSLVVYKVEDGTPWGVNVHALPPGPASHPSNTIE